MPLRLPLDSILRKIDHIPSYTLKGEIELWYDLLKDLPQDAVIIDHGTGWGKSACALAMCAPQAQVITFDTGEAAIANGNSKNYNDYFSKVEEYRNKAYVTNIRQFVGACQDTGQYAGFDIQKFLFNKHRQYFEVWNLDCVHNDEAHTIKEISRFFPYLRPGGLMFVHDYKHWQTDDVRNAVDKELKDKQKVEQVAFVNCGKYGVAAFKKI